MEHSQSAIVRLAEELETLASMLHPHGMLPEAIESNSSGLTAVQEAVRLISDSQSLPPEPLRTVHHMACTGGTLICKCLAALPNVQLLSEVDPLSESPNPQGKLRFAPTDMVTLLRQSTRGAAPDELIALFLAEIRTIAESTRRSGVRLILRDHAHSHFCQQTLRARPTLRGILVPHFSTLSLVTVRNPIDSYLSLRKNNWVQFEPETFDEYCRRYIAFLDAYPDMPIIRYEDFVADPKGVMEEICGILSLSYNEQFEELFPAFRLTGESGRTGASIEPRARRSIPPDLEAELEHAPHYHILLEKLGYSHTDVAEQQDAGSP